MMRVAYVLAAFPTLSETFVLDQIVGLLDRGIDVQVFAQPPPPGAPRHAVSPKYRLEERRHSSSLLEALRGIRIGSLLTGLGRAHLRHARDALRGDKHIAFRTRLELALGLEREGPFDAVVCHFGNIARRIAPLWSSGVCTLPLFTFFHGQDMSRVLARKDGRTYYDELFAVGRWMLPISEYWARRLVELGCSTEKIVVHRMGVDTNGTQLRERQRAPGEPLRLLAVGRLVEKKGFDDALRALAILRRTEPGVHLDLAGDGPLRAELEALAKELRVSDAVTFHGAVVRARVVELLAAAHLFVAPSKTARDGNQEGIPVVLMEALAAGLPVVSTRHTGIPELVEDGVAGRLVDEGDAESLARAITELAARPESWPDLGRAGRRRVIERFELSVLNDQLVAILHGQIR
jgi:colanic acid/amylovoran biosynthesis glycosyltransferase